MKRVLFFSLIVLLSSSAFSQLSSEKLTRKEKKALREEKMKEKMKAVDQFFKDSIFIIQANKFSCEGMIFGSQHAYFTDLARNKYADAIVNPNLYFILINKDEIILQTGLSNGTDLPRVPGITLKGDVKEYKVIPAKNGKSRRIKADFSTAFGFYTLDARITNGGLARAGVQALSSGGSMEFVGDVGDPREVKYYIGGQIY